MAFLEAQNICKKYGESLALNDLNLSIPEQSIYGFLGPNGAGKTTFLRIINRIIIQDSGSLAINGKDISSNQMGIVGYLPEERGLYKKSKVSDQAIYFAQLKGVSRLDATVRLKNWFDKLDIMNWWDKNAEELSKGMQQKIQFIISVLHQPKLLVLDEPLSGLDPINSNVLKDEIKELKKQGMTIVLSTHDMESVEEICDHIALINNAGKILEGNVKEIRKANSNQTFEIIYVGNIISFTTSLWAGYELVDNVEEDGRNTTIIRALNNQGPNEILHAVLPHVTIISVREIIPTMKEIFISKVSPTKIEDE
ncbi:MAG: ATP-binding cassette domain-containing protein [Bacteroidetes bacterium]|nr:ATP-binding cassette domain-containing protein [Bacteroidota bacterium]